MRANSDAETEIRLSKCFEKEVKAHLNELRSGLHKGSHCIDFKDATLAKAEAKKVLDASSASAETDGAGDDEAAA